MEGNYVMKNVGNILMPLGHSLVLHPFTSCKILMQLGYEPDPPFSGHTLFSLLGIGRKAMKYPSIFTYASRVAEKVGWSGLFLIGFPAKVYYTNLSSFVTEQVFRRLTKSKSDTKRVLYDTDKQFVDYLQEISFVAMARISGVMISYPFEVIMIRQIAEILAEDGAGSSYMVSCFTKILREEGIVGFYGGVSSKILGELLSVTVAATLVYGINNYLLPKSNKENMKEYSPFISSMVTSALIYKFTVISTLLAVSGSGLSLSIPLQSFSDAYYYLQNKNGFSRGSSMLIRYAP